VTVPELIRAFDMEKLLLDNRWARYLIAKSKNIILPGFDQVPLYDVIVFFFEQVKKVGLSDRASAISFNFLMAIPSGVIFLFTLIPYLPVSTQITDELLLLTKDIAPNHNTYLLVKNFLDDFLNTPRSGLLSAGFVLAIYYASNAIMGMMRSFNRSLVNVNQRKFFADRLMAIRMTTVIILLIIVTIMLLITQGTLFNYLMRWLDIQNGWVKYIIHSIRWLFLVAVILFGIGFIYKYAPAISKRWKLASPGAILATFLIFCSTYGFSFWVNNFGSYNKVYGSIGTILILMLIIYINSFILLVGYELNVSIHSLKAMAEQRKRMEEMDPKEPVKTIYHDNA
jgi:membrane protein